MTKAQVIALIDQYITTNGNEEITGAQTNSVMKALANQDIPFSEIVSTPTTLSGYGITDAYTKVQSDVNFLNQTNNFEKTSGFLLFKNDVSLRFGDNGEFRIVHGADTHTYFQMRNEGNLLIRDTDNGTNRFIFERTTGNFRTFSTGYFGSSTSRPLILESAAGARGIQLNQGGMVGSIDWNSDGYRIRTPSDQVLFFIDWANGLTNISGDLNIQGNTAYHTGNLTLSTLGGVPTTRSILAGTGLTGGGNLSSNRTINVNFGTSAGTVAQGNDSRINNGQTAFSWGNHASAGYVTLSGGQTITSWKKIVPTNVIADNGAGVMTFGNNGTGAFISSGTGTGGDYSFILRGYESGGVQLDLNEGGILSNGFITATGFYESSDIRLKKNIEPLNYGLNEIEKIDTHTWNWKNNNESDIGVIAQELELIMPELVKTDEDGYKSVNYTKLVPVLINAIKELSNGKK